MSEAAPLDDESPCGSLDELAVDLVIRAPFFGHLLAGLPRAAVPGRAAALWARGAKVWLDVGEELLRSTPRPLARGALKRALLHLLLEHPARRREFPDSARFDLAADLAVTPLLEPEERGPQDADPANFPGFPAEATVDRYYRLLAPFFARTPPPEGSSHASWGSFDEGTPLERTLRGAFVRELGQAAHDRARHAGRLPAGLRRALAERFERGPSVDWRTALRRFRGTAEASVLRETIHRPSKRYGTVPGHRVQRLCRLVAIVDTSGSVSPEDLAAFSVELGHLARSGAQLWVIYCDAVVQAQEAFSGQLPARVPGGGGTAFDPALRAADARDPDGIVYLTDGWVSWVNVRPRAPVLWLLTPGGRDPDTPDTAALLRGRRVRMTAHGAPMR